MAKILVVDDRGGIRLILRLILAPAHEVVLAENGKRAIELLNASVPPVFDLVMTDLHMPEASGMEVLQRASEKGTPVIMMTGGCVGQLERQVAQAGLRVKAFLKKPFEYSGSEILEIVSRAVEP